MPYSIKTKDGITINNIPDDIAPDSDILKQRVASIRTESQQAVPTERIGRAERRRIGTVPGTPGGQLAETIGGVIEPAAAIVSGAIAEPLAGIAGIAQAINPLAAPGAGARAVEATKEALTLQPRTETGRARLQAVGEAVAPIAEAFTGAEQFLGTKTFEATGSPLLSAVAESIPTALGEIAGIAGIRGGIKGVQRLQKQSPTKQRIAQLIEEGTGDIETARFKLENSIIEGAPKVVKDRAAIESINQGFDEAVIAAVKGSSKADKQAFSKMVDIMEKGKKNARFAIENRPSDVVGDLLMQRLRVVQKANRNAGKRLEGVAKDLKGKPVEFQPAIDTFVSDLSDMGITIGRDVDGRVVTDFRGSDIEGLPGPEAAVKRIVKRLSATKPPDAFELHRMKKFIDEQVTFGKNAEGLAGKTEVVLKRLRRNLDETLDSNFPEYDKVNTQYSETIGALDAFQDVAGKKMNLTGKNADKATGTLMRRIMSNAQSRITVLDAVNEVERIAKKFGGKLGEQLQITGPVDKAFSNDLLAQILFVDELDSVFGPVARTSFQGQIQQGVQQAARAAGGQQGLGAAALDVAAKTAERLRGINEAGAFKAIKQLLREKK